MKEYSKVSNEQLIFSIQELKDKGLSYYKINQLVKQGILIKLNKKYYENTNLMEKSLTSIMLMRMYQMASFVF